MRIKYFLVYIIVGAAFLAVSAWVLFSGGKSAKALRTKYRLGGLMLTAWAMLSASSCGLIEGIEPPEVTCYDPVVPENIFTVEKTTVTRGEAVTVSLEYPVFPAYKWVFHEKAQDHILQEGRFEIPEEYDGKIDFQIVPDKELEPGDVVLRIEGVYQNDDGTEESFLVYTRDLVLR